ncbi:MAG TPA: rhodanese-like domain-containing protein [Jiangellaceae bacterium]
MTTLISPALRQAPASPSDAAAFFAARLSFQADVSDVHASMGSGSPGFTLVDSRGADAWAQGRIPGAVHLPTGEIPERAASLLDPSIPAITYCWGPACDGATRAALALAELGFRVKEMIGGVEYWIREGFLVETDTGPVRKARDPLTGPLSSVHCDC